MLANKKRLQDVLEIAFNPNFTRRPVSFREAINTELPVNWQIQQFLFYAARSTWLSKFLMKNSIKEDPGLQQIFANSTDRYHFKGMIGSGAENQVYLYESENPEKKSFVLKLSRMATADLSKIEAIKDAIEYEYSQNRLNYENLPDLIPEMEWSILENSNNKNRQKSKEPRYTLLSIQQYLGQSYFEIQDLGNEFRRKILKALIENDDNFRNQLVMFVSTTKEILKTNHTSVDLYGRCNLVVVSDTKDRPRLVLLDPTGNVDFTDRAQGKKQKAVITFLETVSNLLIR